ncbi:MAG: hypothetical protein RLZZ46_516, partial [Bacteroidota bacterium]
MDEENKIESKLRFPIRRRINLSFLLLIAIFAIGGFSIWQLLERNVEDSRNIFENSNPTLQELSRFQLLITESKMHSTNWVFLPSKSNNLNEFNRIHHTVYPSIKSRLSQLAQQWELKIPQDTLKGLFTGFEHLIGHHHDLMQLLNNFEDYEDPMKRMQAELILEDEITPHTLRLLNQVNILIEIQRELIRTDEELLNRRSSQILIIISLLSIILTAISAFFAWQMGRFVTRPIVRIKHILNKLGRGIIDEIPERKTNDEINDMIKSVNNLSHSLRETANFAEEIGKGNFNSDFIPLSESDTLGKSLITMRENLRKSDALLQEAQELTHNGSWEFDLDKREIWFSDESYRIMGLKKGVDKAVVQTFLNVIHPEDIAKHSLRIRKVIERGLAQTYDIRIIRKSGKVKFLQVIVKPIFDSDNRVVRLFGTILDIDERKNFEADLIKAKEAAEQADRTKSLFLSNMSHEIRTPMNAIIGLSDLLIEDEQNPKQKQRLISIRQSGDVLLKIINEILDFSKIQAGKLLIEKLEFDPNRVVNDTKSAIAFSAVSKGLDFQVITDTKIPKCLMGDSLRLNQILLNLVGNAIKFTEKGFVRLTVDVVNQDSHSVELLFSIIDSGIGIPKEQHEKIFESFNQANIGHSRKYGGTGLGLTITKQLIELQGGCLMLKSEPGIGSTFSFAIKYQLVYSTSQKEPEPSFQIGSGLVGRKVLVAEDNQTNQFVMGQILQKWNVEFAFAFNGSQAVEKLLADDFDLVLMDLQMPEMDGYEACKQIRAGGAGHSKKDIPIIAVSADAFSQTKDKAIAAGMNAFVPKPI